MLVVALVGAGEGIRVVGVGCGEEAGRAWWRGEGRSVGGSGPLVKSEEVAGSSVGEGYGFAVFEDGEGSGIFGATDGGVGGRGGRGGGLFYERVCGELVVI